jgi:hypothetical protein
VNVWLRAPGYINFLVKTLHTREADTEDGLYPVMAAQRIQFRHTKPTQIMNAISARVEQNPCELCPKIR